MRQFSYSTSRLIDASPLTVHALINNFHAWSDWSPWEGIDPDMTRTYTGSDEGVGAEYAWDGNKKAGAGHMKIVESAPERIRVALTFTRPFKSNNESIFDVLTTTTGATDVRWTMTGDQSRVQALAFKMFRMEKNILKDFDKGLAALAELAENHSQ